MDNLKVELKLKFKDGDEKEISFDTVQNVIVDYDNNKLSIFDFSIGYWYHYKFITTDDMPVVKEFKIIRKEV